MLHLRHSRGFRVSAQQGDGKRITQNEFTDKAWQSIIAAPDIAKQVCCLAVLCSMLWCLHACHSPFLYDSILNLVNLKCADAGPVVMQCCVSS